MQHQFKMYKFQVNADGLCTWLNNAPTWFVVCICATYFVLLCLVIFVYADIVARFRQSRKRLEALEKQSGDSYYMVKETKFQRKFGKLAKTLKPTIPGHMDKGISIIRFKNEAYHFTNSETDKPRKRRSSSVVKSLSILVSHVRAATYILVIVSMYLAMGNLDTFLCLLGLQKPDKNEH